MAAVRIDLHVHSNASDGTDAPAEVVRRAQGAGLDVLALTDHDTQAGIAEARAALPPGLTLIPGMELSCQLTDAPSGGRPSQTPPTRSIHLLAYLFDPQDPALAAETAQIRDDRTYRAQAMVGKLRELGAGVTWEQVSAIADGGVVGRPHLARALAAVGAVATPADAFTADWIADGGRAFVDRYAPDLPRAIGLVLAAGGVPVLAHPRSPGYEVSDEAIEALAGAGLRGIEVFHLDHDQSQRSRLAALAGSLDLIMTGGSDDHGTYLPGGRPPVPPASNGNGLGAETTPQGQYERLLALASPAAANLSLLRAPVAGHGRARVRLECPLALEPFTWLSRPKFGRPKCRG
jgi:3',5'-nucleoside bisphosphate phosphatase